MYRNPKYLAYILELANTLPATSWHKIQKARLKNILRTARGTPYWESVFEKLHFEPRLISDKKFYQLPIITRSDLKKCREAFQVKTSNLKHRVRTTTSGSTAEPLEFFRDSREFVWREAGVIYEFSEFGFTLDKPALILGLKTHQQLNSFGTRFSETDIENDKTRKNQLYRFINNANPSAIIGTPTNLKRLAHFLKLDGFFCSAKIIRTVGEQLTPTDRDYLRNIYQGKIFSNYGTRECSSIALECKRGNFHLTPWVNYAEIIDDDGNTLPEEVNGRIVVTYFHNFVMPFIRYDIGDRGVIRTEPCPCGKQTKTITFTGRSATSIETPSGKFVSFIGINSLIAKYFHREIKKFQLEQVSQDKFIFRFAPSEYYVENSDTRLLASLKDIFHNEVSCTIEKVPFIMPNKDGKTPPFIKNFK